MLPHADRISESDAIKRLSTDWLGRRLSYASSSCSVACGLAVLALFNTMKGYVTWALAFCVILYCQQHAQRQADQYTWVEQITLHRVKDTERNTVDDTCMLLQIHPGSSQCCNARSLAAFMAARCCISRNYSRYTFTTCNSFHLTFDPVTR